MKDNIIQALEKIVSEMTSESVEIKLDIPENTLHGDYSSNIALILAQKLGKNPREVAEEIKHQLTDFGKVEVAGPGFINFFVSKEALSDTFDEVLAKKDEFGHSAINKKEKVMIEFAHPNTHKEMHIGHMRTLITGESLSRIYEATGATVFRANYQGDIGPHVAKALYGIKKIMEEENLTIEEVEKWGNIQKAHFLGRGYVIGNQDYKEHADEMDAINKKLYDRDESIEDIYQETRKWNLDYYNDFYKRFYTTFDRLFFESEMDSLGKKIVMENIGKIFKEDDGAVIFPGEEYGLHTRVFITKAGYPTYEGKEMGNAQKEYEAFPFTKKIHVVASEQSGYFKVVFKALELLDPEKFVGKQHHVAMGMVQLSDRKISSRTGDIITVDWLIDEVKKRVQEVMTATKVTRDISDETIEEITIGAIKYSVLKGATLQDVAFDIETSVSLDGNSGPYLQYTYARTQSLLKKGELSNTHVTLSDVSLDSEEDLLLRHILHFSEIIEVSAEKFAPNLICNYLFELSQRFNLFYQKHSVLEGGEKKEFRLALTAVVGQTLKNGLYLLGIEAPEKM